MHAHDNYVIYLVCTVLFAILWPLSTARSLSRINLRTFWILAVVLPYGVASVAVAALIFFGLWSAAFDLTSIASLAIQVVLIPVYLMPHRQSSIAEIGSLGGNSA
jgi:hypothetical protein